MAKLTFLIFNNQLLTIKNKDDFFLIYTYHQTTKNFSVSPFGCFNQQSGADF